MLLAPLALKTRGKNCSQAQRAPTTVVPSFFERCVAGDAGGVAGDAGDAGLKTLGKRLGKNCSQAQRAPTTVFPSFFLGGVLLGMLRVLLVMLGTLALETLGKRLGKNCSQAQRAPTTVFPSLFFWRCVAGDAGGCCFCLLCVCGCHWPAWSGCCFS